MSLRKDEDIISQIRREFAEEYAHFEEIARARGTHVVSFEDPHQTRYAPNAASARGDYLKSIPDYGHGLTPGRVIPKPSLESMDSDWSLWGREVTA